MNQDEIAQMGDDELIASLRRLVEDERRHLIEILWHLQIMDDRRIAEKRAYSSLFVYCVKELRWAEGETARRIQVARRAKTFPLLFRALKRGLLSLSAAALLCPYLTRKNYSSVVKRAYGRKSRDIEAFVATLAPRPEPKESARFLGIPAAVAPVPEHAPQELPAAEASASQGVMPIVPQRVLFSFTADEGLLAEVERAKALLRNKFGDPGFEEVFVEAVRSLLEKIDPERRVVRERQPSLSQPGAARRRQPPAWVKRAVWRRDRGHCAFRSAEGRRCESTAGIQYDHILPWALGGRSDDPANIRLLCRTHNRLEARRSLGDGVVDAALAAAREKKERREA